MSNVTNIANFPNHFGETFVIAREAGEEMVAKLEWMTIKPKRILVVGFGAEEMKDLLQQRYREAEIITDESLASKESIDLICAHFVLSWEKDPLALFRRWHVLLKPEGLLLLTALGPDTLKEWRTHLEIIPACGDMHDYGDMLVQTKFSDPVLDIHHYTLIYKEEKKLLSELLATGMITPNFPSSPLPANDQDKWTVTYEVTFAHAWRAAPTNTYSADTSGIVKIPVSAIK